ncbi:MAG: SDR family oxidoreductase [Gammaproteobacteria bacterium]|nr:SDR family oxidoreductase [Gammaproteobacteria bacterium]
MNGGYAGKSVIITGAATGIGRAIAFAAAARGAKLVLGDVAEERLAATAGELEAAGATLAVRRCDVRVSADLEALAALARERHGPPDILFANAGIEGTLAAPWEVSEAEFLSVLDINVAGIWRAMRAVLPGMVERGSGAIVATASVAGLVGAAGLTPYVASKHAVVGLVKSVAIAVAKAGVRVNAVCPGMIDTPMLDRLVEAEPALRPALLALKPMARLGTADEAAAAAIWLAGSEAAFVTGHALAVDGGYVAQ